MRHFLSVALACLFPWWALAGAGLHAPVPLCRSANLALRPPPPLGGGTWALSSQRRLACLALFAPCRALSPLLLCFRYQGWPKAGCSAVCLRCPSGVHADEPFAAGAAALAASPLTLAALQGVLLQLQALLGAQVEPALQASANRIQGLCQQLEDCLYEGLRTLADAS